MSQRDAWKKLNKENKKRSEKKAMPWRSQTISIIKRIVWKIN